MAYHRSQLEWKKENTVSVNVHINRNQDPELYDILTSQDNKSAIVREALAMWLAAQKAKE